MITYYAYDNQLIYTNPIEIDPYAALPEMATEVAPPETLGTEVTQWHGSHWIILPERPVNTEIVNLELEIAPESAVVLNKVDFLRLFTQQERIDIRTAAATNPVIADYQYMLDAAITVNLQDPDILTGIPLLETAGIIGPGRAVQILSGQGV